MAGGNVYTLFGENPPELGEPNQPLIKAITNLLEMAKTGRLQSFVGTGFTHEGNRLSLWCDTHTDIYQMLGSIAWLEHEYVERQTKAD